MQLKEEFRTYEALRREHDSQIVQIAMEGGLRIAPDQWSSLLYGDQSHKSHMQSIIDKVHNSLILHSVYFKIHHRYACFDTLVVFFVLHFLYLIGSHLAADPSIFCPKCPGVDNCTAEDRRPSQPEQAAAPLGTAGKHRPQPGLENNFFL